MAHKIDFEIPARELNRTPITIWVENKGEKLGRLEISQGGISWYKHRGRKPEHDFSWKDFIDVLDNAK